MHSLLKAKCRANRCTVCGKKHIPIMSIINSNIKCPIITVYIKCINNNIKYPMNVPSFVWSKNRFFPFRIPLQSRKSRMGQGSAVSFRDALPLPRRQHRIPDTLGRPWAWKGEVKGPSICSSQRGMLK